MYVALKIAFTLIAPIAFVRHPNPLVNPEPCPAIAPAGIPSLCPADIVTDSKSSGEDPDVARTSEDRAVTKWPKTPIPK